MSLTVQDLDNAKEDVDTIGSVTNGGAGTVLSRLGQTVKTLQLAIQSIGFSDVQTWTASTLYNDFQVLVVNAGQTYRLVAAHTSTGSFDGSKWLLFSGHAVTTSSTDTTPNALTKVGDGGILADMDLRGTIYSTGSPSAVLGRGYLCGLGESSELGLTVITDTGFLEIGAQWATSSVQDTFTRRFTVAGRVFFQTANLGVDTWGAWQELYHSGNTNFNEFSCTSATQRIAFGHALDSVTALFGLPVDSFDQSVSISVNGTFDVFLGGTPVTGGTGITPVRSSSSTQKLVVLVVVGLSGMTVGQSLQLKSTSASSKITVNY